MPRHSQSADRLRFPLASTVVIFTAAIAVLAAPWLSGAVTVPWDAKSQFLPQVQFLARSIAAGQSPFWTPNVFAGWPQIADPQSLIFSPPHLLLAWIDPRPSFRAVDGATFLTLYLGGLAILLFFRDRAWHAGGALVAALAFAIGGSCASRLQHTGQIASLAYLPFALWMLSRALERTSLRAGAAAGLFAGLTAIGRDQVALLSLYVLAGFVAAYWVAGERWVARVRASVMPLSAAALVGTLLAAVPVVMTVLLAAASNRPEIGYLPAGRGSFHPINLLMFVFPDLFGASHPRIEFWGPPSFAWHAAWGPTDLYVAQNVGQIYAGAILAVAIVGLGIIRRWLWERDIRFFSIAAAVVLLYALGWHTPAFRLMYEIIPGVALFRRPADATFVLGFLLAVIAGYLVHCWLSATVLTASRTQRAAEAGAAGLLIAAATAVALSVGRLGGAVGPILAGIGWAAAAIVTLVIARRLARGWPRAAALTLTLFTTVDLAWNNAPNISTGLPPSVYEALRPDSRNETIAIVKQRLAQNTAPDRRDRIELAGIAYHWPNAGLIHGFDHLFGHNPLRLRDFAAATGVGDTLAVPEQRSFAPLFPSYRSVLADLFGLRLIVTGVPVEEIDTSLQPSDLVFVARTADAYIYENPRALPRVLFVTEWQRADFAALMREGGWPDVDPRKTVLLERAPQGVAAVPQGSSGQARILHYGNTEIVVDVDSTAGGFLVLNDVWHPWWQATVDGAQAETLKGNVLFRAVHVPAGRHTVRFSFHPFAGAYDELMARLGAARPSHNRISRISVMSDRVSAPERSGP